MQVPARRPLGEAVGAQVKDTALGLTDRSVVRKALVLAISLLLVGVLAPIVGWQSRGGADDQSPQRGKALRDAERCDRVERPAVHSALRLPCPRNSTYSVKVIVCPRRALRISSGSALLWTSETRCGNERRLSEVELPEASSARSVRIDSASARARSAGGLSIKSLLRMPSTFSIHGKRLFGTKNGNRSVLTRSLRTS